MKLLNLTLIGLSMLLTLSKIKAQDVNVNCRFAMVDNIYTCLLFEVAVVDDENANFIIGGDHIGGRSDIHVESVQISNSTIPFIITQLFTTFSRVMEFYVFNCGLTRIQSDAFANGSDLNKISILNNAEFRSVHARTFSGASNLMILDLSSNQIETIDESAFEGLSVLQSLFMLDNNIRHLPAGIFTTLTSLLQLSVSDNLLEIIDGRLLANNQQVFQVELARNSINAIGRNFLDNLPSLRLFNVAENVCVDESWTIGGVGNVTLDDIREGLTTCFDNHPENEVRTFILEVRGSLTLLDQNGTIIITL